MTDITEHPTNEGKLYCCAVLDAYSRRILGCSIAHHVRTELVLDALGMAILRRRAVSIRDTVDTILHSDHGTQFTSWVFGQRLREAGLLPSMGTIGDCYDNSMMESFWALQLEVLDSRNLGNTIRACQRHLRMDSVLVQHRTPPFEYRNAPAGGVRDAPPRPDIHIG